MDEPTKYELGRRNLIAKTKRRRMFFNGERRDHIEARRARRDVGGTFGKANETDFKRLAVGTIRGPVD